MTFKKLLAIGFSGVALLGGAAIVGGLIWRASLQHGTQSARVQIDRSTGIDEFYKARVGGIDQWFHVRGVNKSDPVLLWLHGGPGTPMMPFEAIFQGQLEKHFVVVQWDQRGSGKTFIESGSQDVTSFDLMLKDAIEVVDMVKVRYAKQKIVIVGHSWGSMLGLGLIQARPQDVAAYVGTGQVVDITKNETVGYEATLAEAKRVGNNVAVMELEGIAPYPEAKGETPEAKITLLRKWQDEFGFGISRRYRDKISDVMLNAALSSPEYRLRDVGYFVSQPSTPAKLDRDVDAFKASNWSSEYKVPMFLFLGRHDVQTPSVLAAPWLETIKAPSKSVIWFEQSAHSPMLDEPDAFAAALIERVRPFAVNPSTTPTTLPK